MSIRLSVEVQQESHRSSTASGGAAWVPFQGSRVQGFQGPGVPGSLRVPQGSIGSGSLQWLNRKVRWPWTYKSLSGCLLMFTLCSVVLFGADSYNTTP